MSIFTHTPTHILNTVNIECHNLSLPLCDNVYYIQRTHANRIQIHQHLSIFGSSLCSFFSVMSVYWAVLLVFVLLRVPSVFVFNKLWICSENGLLCDFSSQKTQTISLRNLQNSFTFAMRNNIIHGGQRFEIICVQIWPLVVWCETYAEQDAIDCCLAIGMSAASPNSVMADFSVAWHYLTLPVSGALT